MTALSLPMEYNITGLLNQRKHLANDVDTFCLKLFEGDSFSSSEMCTRLSPLLVIDIEQPASRFQGLTCITRFVEAHGWRLSPGSASDRRAGFINVDSIAHRHPESVIESHFRE